MYAVLLGLADTQRDLQLNWPIVRGWDFVSQVVSTTKKKMMERQKRAWLGVQMPYLWGWLARSTTSISPGMEAGWPQSTHFAEVLAPRVCAFMVKGSQYLECGLSLDCFSPRSTCKLLLWMDAVTSAYNNRVFLSSSAIPTWPGMTHLQYL